MAIQTRSTPVKEENELLVSLEKYVDTYHYGAISYTGYHRVKNLVQDKHFSFGQAAREAGIDESTVRGWLGQQKTPQVVKAVKRLQEAGLLPLTLSSEQLPELNRLAAYLHWTGFLGHQQETWGYNGVICGNDRELLEDIQTDTLSSFGIESTIEASKVKGMRLEFGTGFAHYARLLECMGVRTGSQYGTNSDKERLTFKHLQFPEYISNLIQQSEDDGTRNQDEKRLLLLKDFLSVMFTTKSRKKQGCLELELNKCSSKLGAQEYLNEVLRLINAVCPWLAKNARAYFSRTTSPFGDRYSPSLYLSNAKLGVFWDNDPLLFTSTLNPVRIQKGV